MRILILGLIFLYCKPGLSQDDLKIFLGAGLDSTICTLTISYWENETYNTDTLIKNKLLDENYVTGLTYAVNAKIPRKSRKEVKLVLDGIKYNYRFDIIKNNSELRIEFLDGIDFCLFQKRKFLFY